MARISEQHKPKCGVVGKCSRPMYQMGMEVFCDAPAYGEQYTFGSPHGPYWDAPGTRGRWGHYQPYVPALACKAHGGPGEKDIRFIKDGDQWCAFMPGFENLQESDAGFGKTQAEAEVSLMAAQKDTPNDR